jgi:hypothetical protein
MNIHAQMKWWYVYDRAGKLVHSCRCHTESGALADAFAVTGRDPHTLTAQTTFKLDTP